MFLYPRRGFGQIVEAVADAAVAAGVDHPARHRASPAVDLAAATACASRLDDGTDPRRRRRSCRPCRVAALAAPAGGPSRRAAPPGDGARVPRARPARRGPPFDAHYLPDPANPVARLSEPRNYRDSRRRPGRHRRCSAPRSRAGPATTTWEAAPDDLGARLVAALAADGLPPIEPVAVEVVRLPAVYPVYRPGADWDLARAESWLATTPAGAAGRVVTAGRQGLFVPDNTHHVLAMGRAAADCAAARRHRRPGAVAGGAGVVPRPRRRGLTLRSNRRQVLALSGRSCRQFEGVGRSAPRSSARTAGTTWRR